MTDEELIEMATPAINAALKDRAGRSVAFLVGDVPGGPEVHAIKMRDLDPTVQLEIRAAKMRHDQRAVLVYRPEGDGLRLVVATPGAS